MAQCVRCGEWLPNEDTTICLACAEKDRVQNFIDREAAKERTARYLEFTTEEAGLKYDDGKLDWLLVPVRQMEYVVRVLMAGAKKYSPDNWKKVADPNRRYLNALCRHVNKVVDDEWTDPETGLPHLAHAICNALFLLWFRDDEKRSTNSTQE